MTKTVTEKLTRMNALKENMDPFGKRWGIASAPGGYALYAVGQVVEGEFEDIDGAPAKPKVNIDIKYPDECLKGMFTNPVKAQQAIRVWLDKAWEMSDKKTAENAKS